MRARALLCELVLFAAAWTGLLFVGCSGNDPGDDDDDATPSVEVTILAPSIGDRFFVGDPIHFQGEAQDETGAISSERLTWSSSIDGDLGAGAELTRDDLSVGAHTITLTATNTEGVEGAALVSISVVAEEENLAPVPTITAPIEGAPFVEGASITFTGEAIDPEDGLLGDGALQWTSDVDGLLGEGLELTADGLSVGPHVITLTAVDSRGATARASVGIEVFAVGQNLPPVATILEPANGALLTWGSQVTFSGAGQDLEDGALTGAALAWHSDQDGALGTGQTLAVSTLSLGVHEITLTVTDPDGLTDTASILVNANPASTRPPVVQILQPGSGATFTQADAIIFDGEAIDPQDGALSGAALVWSSSIHGEMGTGTRLIAQGLEVGLHTIRLTATDDSGAVATASIQVRVTP